MVCNQTHFALQLQMLLKFGPKISLYVLLRYLYTRWKHVAPRRGTVDTVRRQMLTEMMMSRFGTLLLVVNSTWTSQSSPL
ncbi:hypothetical protein INR49_020051 [Caranx melampygus]|nr:hypothetical protein INR49_020051 [Caranx melampygus]